MSGVSNGQLANETTFDGAYIARNGDSNTVGKLDLDNPNVESGASVTNLQKETNNLFSFLGAAKNQLIGYLPAFANSNGFTAAQSVFARAEALSAKLHQSTGHKHTGAAGDAPAVSSVDLANVVLRGYPIQGSSINTPGANSTNISAIMTGKIASTGSSVKGVVVLPPYNKVPLFVLTGVEANDYLTNAAGDIVFGRITESAGVWTLTSFVDLSGVETAYALTAGQITDGVKWFYQELFNPIVDAPIYDELFFVQSDNTTADVVDATSTQRGLLSAIAQAIGGVKTFVANMIISDTTQSTDKDTGSIVTEGGIGIEKNINAGGNINAVGTVTGSNLSGTNTGDVTLAAIGATPNADGASIAAQVLTLQPANGSFGGVVTTIAQTFAGIKTFLADVVIKTLIQIDGATSGFVKIAVPAAPTSWTLTLPPTAGLTGQVIKNLGAGVTDWGTGSGSGEFNYLENFTPAITKNTVAGAVPDLGFVSGGTNITFALSASVPLRGVDSWILTKDAANRQGEQVLLPFTLERADVAKVLRNLMDYAISSGTYADGDVGVYVAYYDTVATAWKLLNNTPINILNHAMPAEKYQTEFQTDGLPANTSYRLILHIQSVSASAYVLKFDDIRLGSNARFVGSSDTNWKAYPSPPTITGFGTVSNLEAFFKKSGDTIQVRGSFTSGTTTATQASVTLPNVSIDTNKVLVNQRSLIGEFYRAILSTTVTFPSTNSGVYAMIAAVDAAVDKVFMALQTNTTANTFAVATGTQIASVGDYINFYFEVPIAGWSVPSSIIDDGYMGRVVSFKAKKETSQSIPTGTWTKIINWDVPEDDKIGGFSGGTYTFKTALTADVFAQITFASNAVGNRNIQIRKNGEALSAPRIATTVGANPGGETSVGASTTDEYKAGDYVEIYALQSSGGNLGTSTSGGYNIFALSKSAGSSQVLAADKVTFAVTSTSGQATTGGVHAIAICNVKRYDSHNIYDTTNGTFKLPRAGVAQLKARFLTTTLAAGTTNYYGEIRITKNGSPYKISSGRFNVGAGTTTYAYGEGSCDIEGLSTDVFAVEVYYGASTNISADGTQNFIDLVMT